MLKKELEVNWKGQEANNEKLGKEIDMVTRRFEEAGRLN